MIITLNELEKMAFEARKELEAAARSLGREVKIYLHWTAGGYDAVFADYHVCIRGSGAIMLMRDLAKPPDATYHRNTGSIAVTLCCGYSAEAWKGGAYQLGFYPPTDAQIECAAQIIATLADALDIPIDVEHVMTHAEAADNADGCYEHEPYGPQNGCERWDLAVLRDGDDWMSGGPILRGKAKFYRKQRMG